MNTLEDRIPAAEKKHLTAVVVMGGRGIEDETVGIHQIGAIHGC